MQTNKSTFLSMLAQFLKVQVLKDMRSAILQRTVTTQITTTVIGFVKNILDLDSVQVHF